MKPYCSRAFYEKMYMGKFDGEDSEFNRLLMLACQKIDLLTENRIAAFGFCRLTKFQQKMVKYAACFQIDYLIANGIEDGRAVSRYSALDMSVSYDTKSGLSEAEKRHCSGVAYELLLQSGLMWKGL